jgi:hypothetical protein
MSAMPESFLSLLVRFCTSWLLSGPEMLPGIQLQKSHMAFYLLLPKEGSLFIGLDLRLLSSW